LKETPSSNYPQRKKWNVRDSGGTVSPFIAAAVEGVWSRVRLPAFWELVQRKLKTLRLARNGEGARLRALAGVSPWRARATRRPGQVLSASR
jgi:hypothetical protein